MPQHAPDNAPAPDSSRTSKSLLQRARAREPDAWRRLCVLYEPLVRHWCHRGGVAIQDIDDVVQEVFVSAFASLDAFRHSGPTDTFRGWLCGITRHRVLEHFRRLRRQPPAAGGTDAYAAIQAQPDANAGPDDEENELSSHIYRRALDFIRGEFEPNTWQMFWRCVIDGVPTAVIATEMGVTSSTVRQARSRVLRRLREETAEAI